MTAIGIGIGVGFGGAESTPLSPLQITSASCLCWIDPSDSTQLGGTPLAAGTTPPAVTLTGTLTDQPVDLYVDIITGGARGTATFTVYLDGGTTPVASNVTTAATYSIPGSTIVLNFPVGTYNADNTYRGMVRNFNDLTANANHFVNTTSGQQPRLLTGQQNNLPAWSFDGSNDYQVCTGTLANSFGSGVNNSFTWVGVVDVRSVPTGGNFATIMFAGSSTDADVPNCAVRMSATAWQVVRRDNTANATILSSADPPYPGLYYVEWTFDGTTSILRLNGVAVIGGDSGVSGAHSMAGTLTLDWVALGCQRSSGPTNANLTTMYLYDSAWFDAAISDTELTRLRNYFM